jgi:hypothetical protein
VQNSTQPRSLTPLAIAPSPEGAQGGPAWGEGAVPVGGAHTHLVGRAPAAGHTGCGTGGCAGGGGGGRGGGGLHAPERFFQTNHRWWFVRTALLIFFNRF